MTKNIWFIIAVVSITVMAAGSAAVINSLEPPMGSVIFHCPAGMNMEDHVIFVAPADNVVPFDMTGSLETAVSNAIDAGYTVVPFTGSTGESVRWPLEYGEYVAILRDSDNTRMSIKEFSISDDGITDVRIG